MKTIIFALLIIWLSNTSCSNQGTTENKIQLVNKQSDSLTEHSIIPKDAVKQVITPNDIVLDSVGPIDVTREKLPGYINLRVKEFTHNVVNNWCKEAGFEELPDYILFRVFKHEQEFEIWGRNGNSEELKLIKIIEVCAIESKPGPKLKSWDYNTAEGFYTYNIYYTSPSWYMFVKLSNEEINNIGMFDYGSCFKMFINYPNRLDRANSLKIYGRKYNNGTICIHGNCVTACCVAFENKVWLTVFAFGLLHNKSYGLSHIYLFPCRFENTDVRKLFKEFSKYKPEDSIILYPFWENLKEGYLKFNKEQQPLKFRVGKNRYYFD